MLDGLDPTISAQGDAPRRVGHGGKPRPNRGLRLGLAPEQYPRVERSRAKHHLLGPAAVQADTSDLDRRADGPLPGSVHRLRLTSLQPARAALEISELADDLGQAFGGGFDPPLEEMKNRGVTAHHLSGLDASGDSRVSLHDGIVAETALPKNSEIEEALPA